MSQFQPDQEDRFGPKSSRRLSGADQRPMN